MRRRGTALIEFALAFAALWAIASAVFEFGYSMYVYNSLVSALTHAGLYAARETFTEPGSDFTNAVRNMAVYGAPDGGTRALAPGLTPGHVTVDLTRDAAGVPATVSVGVTGYQIKALFRTYTLDGRPRVSVRWMGVYKTPS